MTNFRDSIHTSGHAPSSSGLPSAAVAARAIPEFAVSPLSHHELAIGQRIQDSLSRALEITGRNISRDSICVYFRNGVLTLDYALDDRGNPTPNGTHHRRIVLGDNGAAVFTGYDAAENCERKVTAAPHFASSDDERNLEGILMQTRNFAIDAERRMR
jgi:hypothetical protein